MRYEITIERTVFLTTEFEANSEEEAIKKADEMYEDAKKHPEQLEDGHVQTDYALTAEDGVEIINWKH